MGYAGGESELSECMKNLFKKILGVEVSVKSVHRLGPIVYLEKLDSAKDKMSDMSNKCKLKI